MKFFILIFSIYLSALSVVPCSDVQFIQNNTADQISASLGGNHSDDHHDLCSPFCVCSCCGAIALEFQFKNYSVKQETFGFEFYKIVPARKTSLFSNYNGSIWQPPKIIA